jgi:hypothetical protein
MKTKFWHDLRHPVRRSGAAPSEPVVPARSHAAPHEPPRVYSLMLPGWCSPGRRDEKR